MAKKVSFLGLTLLLLLSNVMWGIHSVFAQENGSSSENVGITYFETTGSTQIHSVKDGSIVGELKENVPFNGSILNENEILLNTKDQDLYVEKSSIKSITDEDGQTTPTTNGEEITLPKMVSLHDPKQEKELGVLEPGVKVVKIAEKNGVYEVNFSGIEGIIDLNDPQISDSKETSDNASADSNITTGTQSAKLSITSSDAKTLQTSTSFTSDIQYFTASDDLAIFENTNGTLKQVGNLKKGQSYQRVSSSDNMHKIIFGKDFGYVYQEQTVPAQKSDIPNLTTAKNTEKTITPKVNVDVFDNSTGSLIPFATIQKDYDYPVIGEMGNWLKINVSGRLGYVYNGSVTIHNNVVVSSKEITASDKYFTPRVDGLGVYDNSSGSLVLVGKLKIGQSYPIIKLSGNWLQVQFGKIVGYVYKGDAAPSTGKSIKNITGLVGSKSISFITDTPVFDNTSGQLVEFGTINKNSTITYIDKMGSWYKVDLAGRLGYVYEGNTKLPFISTDKYFEVLEDNVYVYDNSLGSLTPIALLPKGQTYERIRSYGNWHEIKLGRGTGYVLQASTRPSVKSKLQNLNTSNLVNSDKDFYTTKEVSIYDNSSGKLVPFATLSANKNYPFISFSGNWVQVSLGNRIGYVYRGDVQIGPIITQTNYDITLQDMINKQASVNPQTDLYRNDKSYVSGDYLNLASSTLPTTATIINTTSLNVREGAGTSYRIVGTVKGGQKVNVISKVGNWYEINFGPWKNAKPSDLERYINPMNFSPDSPDYFQFLDLTKSAGLTVSEVNEKILVDKGILTGQGQAFINASAKFNINEIYLISHALLETGNGTSKLANGILVDTVDGQKVTPKTVYNMYGVGALDSCAERCGAETAYKNGWFTPEDAIVGGAQYIGESYINDPTHMQNTLYKMRWNPASPGTHQYATDIGWALKQVTNIKKLYDLVDHYTLFFDVPVYK